MSQSKWDVVIGLEVHAQLNTNTKLFCSCPTTFGSSPNTQVCEICHGHPGVLPVLNEMAVKKAVQVGLAINSDVKEFSEFERKNYFYPDLPKAYQITQLMHPICVGGKLDLDVRNEKKPEESYQTSVRINRIQLEEDAGKLIHSEIKEIKESYVDLNRAGTPLIEIVSEPDMYSADEAVTYFKTLRNLLLYLNVSDCSMQEGSLRCDANISIKPAGSTELGIRAEIKNMNTFKGIHAAIEYEVARQISLKEAGKEVLQQTLLFDNEKKETRPMRSKEEAQDYRYFLDPDLLPVRLTSEYIQKEKEALPELPQEKQVRFKVEYALSNYDTWLLVNDPNLANYFEAAVKIVPGEAKKVCNWISSEVLSILNHRLIAIKDFSIPPEQIGQLVKLQKEGTISGKMAKDIFKDMLESGKTPKTIIKDKNLSVVSDEGAIFSVVEKIINDNPDATSKYRSGNTKVFGFFVGQAMKETKGQANPAVVNRILKETLDKK